MNKSGEWVQTAYTKVLHFLSDDNYRFYAVCGEPIPFGHTDHQNTKPKCKDCVERLAR